MPDLNDKHKDEDLKKYIDCDLNYFKGDPGFKLMAPKEGEEPPEEPPAQEEEEGKEGEDSDDKSEAEEI